MATHPFAPDPAPEAEAPLLVWRGSLGTAAPGTPAGDWSIRRGDWWVLLGPPGSGKSEWLSSLAGIRSLEAGQLRAFGQPVGGAEGLGNLSWRLRVGLVFEHGGRLLHRLSAAENVALPIQYHQNRKWSDAVGPALRLLEFVGLAELAALTPAQMRPWQRQRVGLARALALEPEVLLVDNPTAGLPALEVAWWQDRLAQLHRGDALPGYRATTLVLAGDDPRPWWERGTRFARARGNVWEDLGGRAELAARREALTEELLARRPG